MQRSSFWYVDDSQGARWAVRVSEQMIVFTSRDAQIRTEYPLDKEERELSCYELLELLALAKAEAVGADALARWVA